MFRFQSAIAKTALRKIQSRNISLGTIGTSLQENVWRKSTINYITYIAIACIAAEAIYGTATETLWESMNQGKLYHQIDWTKFKSEDDEEEEDE